MRLSLPVTTAVVQDYFEVVDWRHNYLSGWFKPINPSWPILAKELSIEAEIDMLDHLRVSISTILSFKVL